MAIGTTRNLTPQFIKLRNETRRATGISTSQEQATAKLLGTALGSSSDVEVASTSGFSPSWLGKSEKIRAEMSTLREKMKKLKEAHSKALLVTFDGDDNEGQAHVDAITRDVQGCLRRLDQEVRSMDEVRGPNEDVDVRKQVQQQLAQALLKVTVEFRKEQTRYLNKKAAQKGIKVGGGALDMVDDSSQGALADMDPGFTQTQLAAVDISTALAEERDREIRKIVETITELAQIMQDLSKLVVEQGTILDRIDRNIATTAEKVAEGVVQIEKAEKTQKMSRMMMCIVGLIVAIVLLLIIIIIRHA